MGVMKTLIPTLLLASILILAREKSSQLSHLWNKLWPDLSRDRFTGYSEFPPKLVLLWKDPKALPAPGRAAGAGSRESQPLIFPALWAREPDSCSKVEKFRLAEEPVLRKLFNSSSISTC